MNESLAGHVYTGANTTSERGGKAKGIRVFEIDDKTGEWTLIQEEEAVNPGFLVINRKQTRLYCTHANHDEISAYAVDQERGTLKLINRRYLGGWNGTHLTLEPSEKYVLVAAATTGLLAVFPVETDGSLGPMCEAVTPQGELGPLTATEQPNSMPHQVIFSPDGKYVFAPDRGEDMVHTFSFDRRTGKLLALHAMRTRAARTPRHLAFSPNGSFAYLLTEFSAGIVSCRLKEGVLVPFQIIANLPEDYVGLFNKGAEIAVHPSGRFLYASNRGHNSIAVYSIDEKTGWLTSVEWHNTYGEIPRFFCIEPGGNYLYAANEKSGTVTTFLIDQKSGKLQFTGQIIKTPTPTCLIFTKPVCMVRQQESFRKGNLKPVTSDYRVYSYPTADNR
ncbi:lactonase family protein [Clostridium sp. AM58-1XD]|uniref:lactonase family protein n=1 Tax=Clostridium sp. AM58-1XD TaxID=2292307 RepID=UPI0015F4467E|nr:lactonase family protein [Clostridium sp. AM58-1XD]